MTVRLKTRILNILVFAATFIVPYKLLSSEAYVIVIIPEDLATFGTRLSGELTSRGFTVIRESSKGEEPSREKMEKLAEDKEAIAVFYVSPSKMGVEVWVVDRLTRKTVRREIVESDGKPNYDITALRAVEVLRASLLEIDLPEAREKKAKAPPAVINLLPGNPTREKTPVSEPERGILDLRLGPALTWSPGGFSPFVLVCTALDWLVSNRTEIEFHAKIPTFPVHIERDEGSSSQTFFLAGTSLRFALAQNKHVSLKLGLGAGFAWLRTNGSAKGTYSGNVSDIFSFTTNAVTSLEIRIVKRFWLYLDVAALLYTPRLAVEFAGTRVATFGRLAFDASLGISVRLF